jgi:hypothetical protein
MAANGIRRSVLWSNAAFGQARFTLLADGYTLRRGLHDATGQARLQRGKEEKMSEYVDPPERALRFLREHGHTIGETNGHFIIVDGKSYQIGQLTNLANNQHHVDWLRSENAFLDSQLSRNTVRNR